MKRLLLLLGAIAVVTSPAAARDSLGIYEEWGAFRDPETPRCYAIARPERGTRGQWQPYVSIGNWPERNVSGQIHVRLRREMREDSTATLRIGDRRFELVGRGPDAWAANSRADAAIIAAMRTGMTMRIEAVASSGRFRDSYSLRGAASAIDAAALGCTG